ncbi:MAG: hypothetical protein Q9N68_05085 [Gammaproteobacteria bacterium]|nr:hypothetical protein [Gammaproteobacteria bacterium]
MSSHHYLLVQKDGEISVYHYAEKTLTLLKFKGETQQDYASDPERFWRAFKEKIEYHDEKLGFIVFSDQETLNIPDTIVLCNSDDFHPAALSNVYELGDLSQLNQFSHPPLVEFDIAALANNAKETEAEAITATSITPQVKEKTEVIEVENAPILTPQDFFTKKTRDYKNS